MTIERHKVIIIGGGQAGLSVAYHLARRGIPFVILDANARIGNSWRARWDSLRLFTPSQFDGLDGMPFPARAGVFPPKDQMADYLATYAQRFRLPVRPGITVDDLSREDGCYRLRAGGAIFEADQVVVAMSSYQKPSTPSFARELAPNTFQTHAMDYRNPSQLRDGAVLVVGAGNSGAEIAVELAQSRKTWLAGRDVGEIPFRMTSFWGRHVQSRIVLRHRFHHRLSLDTPAGRQMRATLGAPPLIRTRSGELNAAQVERTQPVAEVKDGRPVLADGRTMDVANVIWCTGFHTDFSWIRRPLFDAKGMPRHLRGVADGESGLYFVGLNFLYAASSTMVHGVGRDASHIAGIIAGRL